MLRTKGTFLVLKNALVVILEASNSSLWCMTTRDRERLGSGPANVSVVSGCGSLESWLSSAGSVTVFTPDKLGQGRGSKISQLGPYAADILGSGVLVDRRDIWTHMHMKPHTWGKHPSLVSAALDSVMKGKALTREQISERLTWDNTGFNEEGTYGLVDDDRVSCKCFLKARYACTRHWRDIFTAV